MTPLEKLLRKVSAKDRDTILAIVEQVIAGDATLHPQKLSESNRYKVRKGDFRFIFHYEHNGVIIDAVRLRNEKTYRDV